LANEAVQVIRKSNAIDFYVADGTGIEKGTLLKLSGQRAAAAQAAANDAIAGVAAAEKIASDGNVSLSVFRDGVFKMTLSGTCAVGDFVASDASLNHVRAVDANAMSGSRIIGTTLESGTTGNTILVDVNIR